MRYQLFFIFFFFQTTLLFSQQKATTNLITNLLLMDDYAKYGYFSEANTKLDLSYSFNDTTLCDWSSTCTVIEIDFGETERIQSIKTPHEEIRITYQQNRIQLERTGKNAQKRSFELEDGLIKRGVITAADDDTIVVDVNYTYIDSTQIIVSMSDQEETNYWKYYIFLEKGYPQTVMKKTDWSGYNHLFSFEDGRLKEVLDFGCGKREAVQYTNLIKNDLGHYKRSDNQYHILDLSRKKMGALSLKKTTSP